MHLPKVCMQVCLGVCVCGGGSISIAILDSKVKMVLEHSKNYSITFVIAELTGNVTSFDSFLSRHLYLVLHVASEAIVASRFEFESWDRPKLQMNTILSDLKSQI